MNTKMNFRALWQYLRGAVIEHLRGKAIKIALRKLLGTATGFKAFLVKFIVTELFDHLAEPIIKLSFRKMGYVYNRIGGEIKVKKLSQARQDGDRDEVDDLLDNV